MFQDEPDSIRHCVGRVFDQVSTVLTFKADLGVQAHLEAWAGTLSLEVFTEQPPLAGSIVMFINDGAPALAALKKGFLSINQFQG